MKEKNSNQNLIDRYVYDVVRRLPKDQRKDIELEIRDLIDDLMNESDNDNVEGVLKNLGAPAELSMKYRDKQQYLIGPEYFESYIMVMKIVWICAIISAVVSAVISMFTQNNPSSVNDIINVVTGSITSFITSGIISLTCSFGFVTLIFAILERQKIKVDLHVMENWEPLKLPLVPDKKALIKRSDSIASIIFILIFMGLMIFNPRRFGALVEQGGEWISIPLFNLEIMHITTTLFLAWLGIGLIDEIIRLVIGRYCVQVAISNVIAGVIQLIVAVITLKWLPFWNSNFIVDLKKVYDISSLSKSDLLNYWNTEFFSNLILLIIIFVTLLEVGITIYKTIQAEKQYQKEES